MIFENVSFSYGKKQVLHELSFEVAQGEILAVMGESGCGKTTLLSLAAGLLSPDTGSIRHNTGERISYAFQEPRLFPWLTAKENVEAVLSKDCTERAAEALSLVHLSKAAELYPEQLSGGMKSRVSLARALAFDGTLYLLDEPFSALDEELRGELCVFLRRHIKERGARAILVTHGRADAEIMADRILELSNPT